MRLTDKIPADKIHFTSFSIPNSLFQQLLLVAEKQHGGNRSRLVRQALYEYFERHP